MIRSHVRLMVAIPETAPERMVEKWALGLVTYAEIINQNRKDRLPDETKFQERLATPSSEAYQGFVNPGFISKSDKVAGEITNDQGANLKNAFEKYAEKLDHAFEAVDGVPAKRFKEAVENAKRIYGKRTAQRGLPFTGSYLYGLGPATIAPLWLVNDPTVEGSLRAGDDVYEGGPFMICRPLVKSGLKAALTQRLIQAGSRILKAGLDPMVIAAQNDRINQLVQGFIDPALGLDSFTTGGLSHVDYIIGPANALYLDVQVSQV